MTFFHPSTENFLSHPSTITDISRVEQARCELGDVTDRIRRGEIKPSRRLQKRLAQLAGAALSYPGLPALEALVTAEVVLANTPSKYQTPALLETLTDVIEQNAPNVYANDPREIDAVLQAIDTTDRDRSFPEALETARHDLGQPTTELIIFVNESLLLTQRNKNNLAITAQATGAHEFNPFEDD